MEGEGGTVGAGRVVASRPAQVTDKTLFCICDDLQE
jgi:hypothetical protein